jgi:hypothetical protein
VRAEKYGIDKIVRAQKEWEYPGPHLRPVHTEVGYHFEQGDASSKVLFVGDSNMEQYYPRIDKLLAENPGRAKGVLFVTQQGCLPIRYMKGFAQTKCAGMAERALSLGHDAAIDAVVISAGWTGYSVFRSRESEQAFDFLASMIADYVSMGRKVYLILPMPNGPEFDPENLVRRGFLDFGFKIIDRPVPRFGVDEAVKPMTARLTDTVRAAGASVIDPIPDICGSGDCPTFMEDGLPIYKDGGHLRPEYVRRHITFLDSIVCRP